MHLAKNQAEWEEYQKKCDEMKAQNLKCEDTPVVRLVEFEDALRETMEDNGQTTCGAALNYSTTLWHKSKLITCTSALRILKYPDSARIRNSADSLSALFKQIVALHQPRPSPYFTP